MDTDQLAEALNKGAAKLKSGYLSNEAEIKNAVILPVLGALGWDSTNTLHVKHEYNVNKGRVDYALIGPYGNPLVFLEAKNLGKLNERGEEQLFRYANAQGIPLLILTDGNRWNLYQSMAAGPPADRLFASFELLAEHQHATSAEILRKVLQYDQVASGKGDAIGRKMLSDRRERLLARKSIPLIWRSLLKNADSRLCELIRVEVENSKGAVPNLEDISAFLVSQPISHADFDRPRSQAKKAIDHSPIVSTPAKPTVTSDKPQAKKTNDHSTIRKELDSSIRIDPPTATIPPKPRKSTRISGFEIDGSRVGARSGADTLVQLLQYLAGEDLTFLERYAEKTVTRTRRLVSTDPRTLFPDYDKMSGHIRDLGNGWYVGVNWSSANIRKWIAIASEVSGKKIRVIGEELDSSIRIDPPTDTVPRKRRKSKRITGFEIDGSRVRTKSGADTLVQLLQYLAGEDLAFLERYAEKTVTRTRRLVSMDPRTLFPDYDKMSGYIRDLGNGWYVGINLSNSAIRKRIAVASEISGKEIRVLEEAPKA